MKIAINIPEYYASAWKIAAGAFEYAVINKDIQILLPNAPMAAEPDTDPRNWDAAITVGLRPDLTIPQVCVSSARAGDGVNAIIDENKLAKLAVEQFVSIGLGNLAFFGSPGLPICQLRWNHFSRLVKELGGDPVFIDGKRPDDALRQMRKPCGILVTEDDIGFYLIRTCNSLGIRIPGEIYVISIGDAPGCTLQRPTLSSISLPWVAVGFQAASLCARQVCGETVESVLFDPSGLIVRDSLKVESDDLKTATEIAHFLRMNLADPIQMEDLERRSQVCRRHLSRIFTSARGQSPMAFLKELRLEKAKEMLRLGNVKVKDVASQCGYTDTTHLCRIFKKYVGLTPQAYAQTHGNGSD